MLCNLFQNTFSAWNGSDNKIFVNNQLSKFGIPQRCVADCEKYVPQKKKLQGT
jgi:hypothetical protein